MDAPVNEVIKNIIHIDKSAVQLRDKLSKEIVERKKQANLEIERLRLDILDAGMKELDEIEEKEIKDAENRAASIKVEAMRKSNEMYDSFLASKDDLIKEIFRKVISESA